MEKQWSHPWTQHCKCGEGVVLDTQAHLDTFDWKTEASQQLTFFCKQPCIVEHLNLLTDTFAEQLGVLEEVQR